jgi:hypothetical protein
MGSNKHSRRMAILGALAAVLVSNCRSLGTFRRTVIVGPVCNRTQNLAHDQSVRLQTGPCMFIEAVYSAAFRRRRRSFFLVLLLCG